MKKFVFIIGFILLLSCAYASQFTTKFGFEIPSAMSRDWLPAISQDIISFDTIFNMISNDLGTSSEKIIISNDAVTSVGGCVGRIRIISQDGTAAFIQIYKGN